MVYIQSGHGHFAYENPNYQQTPPAGHSVDGAQELSAGGRARHSVHAAARQWTASPTATHLTSLAVMFYKVIACEIAFRELCYAAAQSRNLIDLEFLTQGYHDIPGTGRAEIQKRIDAVPAGKYDAILLGYGLCSTILTGLTTAHTPLVIPRAHDCITFFLGSKERYQECFNAKPGTYYYTSGWLECAKRRGSTGPDLGRRLAARQRQREPQGDLRAVGAEIRRGPGQVSAGRNEPLDQTPTRTGR